MHMSVIMHAVNIHTQLYFTGRQGEKCGSTEVDIWAGSVTMMKALIGFGKIHESTEQVNCLDSVHYHVVS